MGFDARKAKALMPGEHLIVAEAPGLRLVATVSRRTWTYRFKSPIDGRMRQIALGQWPSMSYAAAMGAWQEIRVQRDSGVDPSMARRAQAAVARAVRKPHGEYLVSALIEDYLTGHIERHRKPKGAAETRRLCEGYTKSIASMPVTAVKRADAFSLLEQLGARAPVLANTLRTELGAAWDYALDAGRIPEETPNWWRQILRGKLRSRGKVIKGERQGRKFRALGTDEVGTLLRYLPNFTTLIADLLTMYLWTGARGSEIVALRGDEVSQESDGWWWTVPVAKLKMARNDTATDLRIPLVGRALALVRRRMDIHGGGHLFPGRVTPHVDQKVVGVAVWAVRPDTVTDRLPAGRSAVLRLAHWSPHDLRRTVRTKLASMGCPDDVGEAVLGHLPAGVVGVYNRHSYDAERRHWLTLLSEQWEAAAAF